MNSEKHRKEAVMEYLGSLLGGLSGILIFISAIFIIVQVVMMFLLPFFVYRIRNDIIDIKNLLMRNEFFLT